MNETSAKAFIAAAQKQGWAVLRVDISRNVVPHPGLSIEKGGESHIVDIRSRKKISRADEQPQDEWQWIELHGVQADDAGWLFGRKNDWIAFETRGAFTIIAKKKVISFLENNVDFTSTVTTAAEARYRVYSRKGRADAITLVETSQLNAISEAIWEKIMETTTEEGNG